MTADNRRGGASIVPCMRYRDAPAAIEWLCRAFGFEKRLVVPGEDRAIAHSQLTFGSGMVMVGSVGDTEFDRCLKQPDEIGNAETQAAYIIVDDVDAHHARAKNAGASVLVGPRDEPHGGRSYSCRDPEGHLWNFGSYDPWADPTS